MMRSKNGFRVPQVEDYVPLIGATSVARLREKARALNGTRVVHVNSTYYGGGVAEILSSLTLLMNDLDIATEWRTIRGTPEFFDFTRTMHDALQGQHVDISRMQTHVYEQAVYENALRNRFEPGRDLVVIHDPQPAALIEHYNRSTPWIWRCHVDLSAPHAEAWRYLSAFVEQYDAVVLSCPEYARDLRVPQHFFFPAIDPFSAKNREMTEAEIDERLARYGIPTDLPIVTQVSRFDQWKDPVGVIEAFNIARKSVPATLVLLGNFATDDPRGAEMLDALTSRREERVLILPCDDPVLVNALQRRAAVVLQKSLREGFGLTVTEAMWKGTPVIGGAVGGIPYQIDDGENGYLVSSVEEAAERMIQLLRDPSLKARMGRAAKEKARSKFLLTRYLEQYLDLFASLATAGKPSALTQAA